MDDSYNKHEHLKEYASYISDGEFIGILKLNPDAPEHIRKEAIAYDKDHFERTGRHKIIVD